MSTESELQTENERLRQQMQKVFALAGAGATLCDDD